MQWWNSQSVKTMMINAARSRSLYSCDPEETNMNLSFVVNVSRATSHPKCVKSHKTCAHNQNALTKCLPWQGSLVLPKYVGIIFSSISINHSISSRESDIFNWYTFVARFNFLHRVMIYQNICGERCAFILEFFSETLFVHSWQMLCMAFLLFIWCIHKTMN